MSQIQHLISSCSSIFFSWSRIFLTIFATTSFGCFNVLELKFGMISRAVVSSTTTENTPTCCPLMANAPQQRTAPLILLRSQVSQPVRALSQTGVTGVITNSGFTITKSPFFTTPRLYLLTTAARGIVCVPNVLLKISGSFFVSSFFSAAAPLDDGTLTSKPAVNNARESAATFSGLTRTIMTCSLSLIAFITLLMLYGGAIMITPVFGILISGSALMYVFRKFLFVSSGFREPLTMVIFLIAFSSSLLPLLPLLRFWFLSILFSSLLFFCHSPSIHTFVVVG